MLGFISRIRAALGRCYIALARGLATVLRSHAEIEPSVALTPLPVLPLKMTFEHAIVPAGAGQIARREQLLLRIYVDSSTSVRKFAHLLGEHYRLLLDEIKKAWVAAGNDPNDMLVSLVTFNRKRFELEDYKPVDNSFRWISGGRNDTYVRYGAQGTSLYDTVIGGTESAIDAAQARSQSTRVRSVVVFMTDGFDSTSEKSAPAAAQAVADAQKLGVGVVYVYLGNLQKEAEAVSQAMGVSREGTVVAHVSEDGLAQVRREVTESVMGTRRFGPR